MKHNGVYRYKLKRWVMRSLKIMKMVERVNALAKERRQDEHPT